MKHSANALILAILYLVFFLTSGLLALEIGQLFGLTQILLSSDGLDGDTLFDRFYNLIARETKITGVLFEIQVSAYLHRGSSI